MDPDERKLISMLLNRRLEKGSDLTDVVAANDRDYNSIVGERSNKLDAIKAILDDVATNGWTLGFLQALVDYAHEHFDAAIKEQEIAMIQSVITSFKRRWGRGTALANPFRSCFVRNDWPYVNRPEVSEAFESLDKAAGGSHRRRQRNSRQRQKLF